MAAHIKSLEDNIQLKGGLDEAHAALAKAKTDKEEVELCVKLQMGRFSQLLSILRTWLHYGAERLRLEKKAVTDLLRLLQQRAKGQKTRDEEQRKLQEKINTAKACEAATRKDFERETATSSLLQEQLAAAKNQLKLNI